VVCDLQGNLRGDLGLALRLPMRGGLPAGIPASSFADRLRGLLELWRQICHRSMNESAFFLIENNAI